MIATEPRITATLIFCEGFRKHGQRCKIILGAIDADGVVTVKHAGRTISDVRGPIRCEICGWIYHGRAGK